jgi:Probable zinc-ribbon domain
MKPAPRKSVPVEKELWSEKSRAGLDYTFAHAVYEDKAFNCRACGAASVFTAEQQKYTYEVKKSYTWEQHVLCPSCFQLRNVLTSEAMASLASWVEGRAALGTNVPFMRRWKEVLEQLPRYGVRKDTARIRMLEKLLENAA